MNTVSFDNALQLIRDYCADKVINTPFFIVFDSCDVLKGIKKGLMSFPCVRLSNYCSSEDVFPDEDKVCCDLSSDKQIKLLLGVGEYISLKGDNSFLERLLTLQLKGSKVVVPVWNGYDFFQEIINADPRIRSRTVVLLPKGEKIWGYRRVTEQLSEFLPHENGFKSLLAKIEDWDGDEGTITVLTHVPLNDSLGICIDSVFDIFCEKNPNLSGLLKKEMFDDKQWASFCNDKRTKDLTLFGEDFLFENLCNPPENCYLKYVIERIHSFKDYQTQIFDALLNVPCSHRDFEALYNARKALMKTVKNENAIIDYVVKTRRYEGQERLFYLTDNTDIEKMAILETIVKCKSFPSIIEKIYPDLWAYQSRFVFSNLADDNFACQLTDYFCDYKDMKLRNIISDDFKSKVEDCARNRTYFQLEARNSEVELRKGANVKLYWLDAMGCEFLGFIQKKSKELGLNMQVFTSRATLPTLTSENRDFFDSWQNDGTKSYSRKLDDIKHGDFNPYGYKTMDFPVHIAYELNIIKDVLSQISQDLHSGGIEKIILTSDHGASRLAVISKNETIWEMPEKGKHSGRCCKKTEFNGTLPDFVVKDDPQLKWYVMANYNRFKGGRQADVEIHGGATLEEVVVPVIEFTLHESDMLISLITKEIEVGSHTEKIQLELFCPRKVSNIYVEIGEKRYSPQVSNASEDNKMTVKLPPLSPGNYNIKFFHGDTVLSQETLTVKSAGVQIKDDKFFDL